MNYFQNQLQNKHLKIVSYFIDNPFSSNLEVLTYLSTLHPIDRCIILEKLFETTNPDINLYDKLVLAYVKAGRPDFAQKLIEYGIKTGKPELNQLLPKLALPVPAVRSKEQQLAILNQYSQQTNSRNSITFLNLLIEFISS